MANEAKTKAIFKANVDKGIVTITGASLRAELEGDAIELKPITMEMKMSAESLYEEAARSAWIRIQGTYRRAVNSKKDPKTHSVETFEDLFGYDLEARPAQVATKKVDKMVKQTSLAVQEIMTEKGVDEATAKRILAEKLGLI